MLPLDRDFGYLQKLLPLNRDFGYLQDMLPFVRDFGYSQALWQDDIDKIVIHGKLF
jgi:hypothetical protein